MLEVVAKKITDKKIFYECPYCFTNKAKTNTYSSKFYKNGREAVGRIPTIHHHGNEHQTTEGNWTTHRCSHCRVNDEGVNIHITDETIRQSN